VQITLYSKLQCPGCDQIKNYLKAAGATYSTITAGVDLSVEEMQQEVLDSTGHQLSSVPFVMVDGEALGGLDKFMPWFREHKDSLRAATTQDEDLDLGDLSL